ncbi:hypothetical protein [Micromonospora thermarum]|uniref:hypothetical protein n=1 Tax=Micromonospora thermarum TaxID=2720024 RepID=UPI001F0EB0FA|nr:hypothetical protein [Micromonospora thermarum]
MRGMATAAGIAAGVFVWSVAAATGVAALLAASATAFAVVKLRQLDPLVTLAPTIGEPTT